MRGEDSCRRLHSLTITSSGNGLPVPTGATAAIVSVTATDETSSGYLTLDPSSTPPGASNLNWSIPPGTANPPGTDVTHLVIVPLSAAGTFTIWNSSGSTDVTMDVIGYVG
ncbi:MAG: hypothetical protein ACYDGY_07960 [Acidimicrobiales bacterium]